MIRKTNQVYLGGAKTWRMRWVDSVPRMVEKKNVYRVMVGQAVGKKPLWKKGCSWKDNIKIVLKEIEWDDGWTLLAQDWER